MISEDERQYETKESLCNILHEREREVEEMHCCRPLIIPAGYTYIKNTCACIYTIHNHSMMQIVHCMLCTLSACAATSEVNENDAET